MLPEAEAHLPDPRKGVFETMLIVNQRPVELGAHLARLSASLKALFNSSLPPGARELVLEHSGAINLGRLRLSAAPGPKDLELAISSTAVEPALLFPAWPGAVDLRSFPIERWSGAHKWADRTLIESKEATAGGAVPLLLSDEQAALEASRANLFLVRGEAILTPPTDGRILPGIARAAVIAIAGEAGIELREEEISLTELLAGDEVFLSGSVRGVEPVASIDANSIGEGELTPLIAAELSRRWLGEPQPLSAAAPAAAPRPGWRDR